MPPQSPKIQSCKSLYVLVVLILFVNIVFLPGMVLEMVVDCRMGNFPGSGLLTYRIVQKYLASDGDGRKLMEMMYGEKVLKKLVELWKREIENENASRKFIRENTVPPQKCIKVS
jgi:hypothetical protein